MRRIRQRRITIEDKVAFLASRHAYADAGGVVHVKETHMSWVFLTHRHAYKLKKPVRYGPLDYASVAARRRNCAREVRLNRRLAPDVYLGKLALTLDDVGDLHLGGPGRTVDWLVKMRRLAANRTLEHAINGHMLRPNDIDAVATRLGAFYRETRRISVSPEGYCRALEAQVVESHRQLSRAVFALDRDAIDELAAAQMTLMERRRDLFAERARSGRIVEGHGDLRPEHIYLYETPIIVDCLEFDRRLRTVDPASELAFLAMECDRLGAAFVEVRLFKAYRRETQDDPSRQLISAYKFLHAYLRAKIAISHLDDVQIRQPLKWKRRTRQYLELAGQYADALRLLRKTVPRRR